MIPLGNTVAVRVQTSAGEAYSGAVADVDIGKSVVRILVDFNRTHAPDLAIGEKALLFFAEFGQREPSEVLGVAIFRSEDPVRKRHQFQIGRIIGIPRVRRTLGRAYVAGCQAGWIWAMKDAWRKKTG